MLESTYRENGCHWSPPFSSHGIITRTYSPDLGLNPLGLRHSICVPAPSDILINSTTSKRCVRKSTP